MKAWIEAMFDCDAGLLSNTDCANQASGSVCISIGSVVENRIEHMSIEEGKFPSVKHKTSMVVQPSGVQVYDSSWKIRAIEDSIVIVCGSHARLLDEYGVDTSQECDTIEPSKE